MCALFWGCQDCWEAPCVRVGWAGLGLGWGEVVKSGSEGGGKRAGVFWEWDWTGEMV